MNDYQKSTLLLERALNDYRTLIYRFNEENMLTELFKNPNKITSLNEFFEIIDVFNIKNVKILMNSYKIIESEMLPEVKKDGHEYYGVFVSTERLKELADSILKQIS